MVVFDYEYLAIDETSAPEEMVHSFEHRHDSIIEPNDALFVVVFWPGNYCLVIVNPDVHWLVPCRSTRRN